MEKVSFSGPKTRLKFRTFRCDANEYNSCLHDLKIKCKKKKDSLHCYRVSQTMPNHSQNLFLIGSSCFCLYMFGEFANVFEGPSDEYMQATHLNSATRSLSSPSRCFQLQILSKISVFRYLLC